MIKIFHGSKVTSWCLFQSREFNGVGCLITSIFTFSPTNPPTKRKLMENNHCVTLRRVYPMTSWHCEYMVKYMKDGDSHHSVQVALVYFEARGQVAQ